MMLHSKRRSLPVEIVRSPEIMGGEPTFRGTRIPVETILVYLCGGCSRVEIFDDFPRLPLDGIEAAIAWAEKNVGANWRNAPAEPAWTQS
jgi:uncharacterized protein (DUF433 family)